MPLQYNTPERNEFSKFFIAHAFEFLKHADQILSDKRMFMAPVPLCSFMGHLKDGELTLGMYVRWWLKSPINVTRNKEGKPILVYYTAGSYLTGSNSTGYIYPNGETGSFHHSQFINLLKSMLHITSKYRNVKVEPYTIQEVYQLITKTKK